MSVITGPLAALKLAQIAAYDSTLHDAAKRVFVLFAGYADTHGLCWPSIKKMAKNLGMSRQAVIKQINTLIDHSYISKQPRYDQSGARRSNIYQLNYDLANKYHKTPEIFCKNNVTLVVTYLVILSSNSGMEPLDFTCHVSSLGDPNKTTIKEHNKKHSQILRRTTVNANAWQEEKHQEKITGVTAEHKKSIEEARDKLRRHHGPMQMTQCDIDIRQKLKTLDMSPLEQAEFVLKELECELQNCVTDETLGTDRQS